MMERLIFVGNSLVALLFAIPAVVMLPRASHSLAVPALAFVWCLFFEYLYHRWFQHRPGTIFADKHHLHHATYRRENEEEHLNFGGHPIYVALLFIVNGAPLVAVDLIFHTRRSEEHTSELQSQSNLVCRLLLEKKKKVT